MLPTFREISRLTDLGRLFVFFVLLPLLLLLLLLPSPQAAVDLLGGDFVPLTMGGGNLSVYSSDVEVELSTARLLLLLSSYFYCPGFG